MTDQVIKTILFDGKSRVLIVRRADGHYSWQLQALWEAYGVLEWSPPGPYGGVYDSAETAEQEAIARRVAKST